MAFDFKKEYKEFYLPKNKPQIVNVPKANFIAVRGQGDPNEEGGEYQRAMGVLYSVAYTLKMSYMTDYRIEGFLSMWCRPWRGSGGRRASRALTMVTRRLSSGFPSFACLTL